MELKTKEVIVKLRKSKGWPQEELASRLQVSRQTVSAWERGLSSIDVDSMILLCHEFDLTVEEFLKQASGEEEIEENSSKDMQIVDKLTEVIDKHRTEQKEIEKLAKIKAKKHIVLVGAVTALFLIVVLLTVAYMFRKPQTLFSGMSDYEQTIAIVCVVSIVVVDVLINAVELIVTKISERNKEKAKEITDKFN